MVLQRRPLEISLLLQYTAYSAANLHHNKPLPAASRDPQTAAGGKCLTVSWVIRYIWLSLLVCLLELFNPGYLLKKFQGLFFFFFFLPFLWIPDLFLLCSQTSSSLKSEWQAELHDLNIDPYKTQLLKLPQEYFMLTDNDRKDICFCCHFACTPFPSMPHSFPGLLILICHISWKQQRSALFRRDRIYATTFAFILS